MKRKNFLIWKNVRFYSDLEKKVFFEFIEKIKSIAEFEQENKKLYLYFKSKRIPDKDLRALIGLFDRFKIDMKQLKIFLNERNKKWFKDGAGEYVGYWVKKVFG